MDREPSLDLLRGITLALMIIVGNGMVAFTGFYAQLSHSVWNGLTLTDLIMPLFIFVVGLTIPYSFSKRLARRGNSLDIVKEKKKSLIGHILQRTFILIALGFLLNYIDKLFLTQGQDYILADTGLYGVLFRIALCYLVASLTFLYLKPKWRIILAMAIPLVYYFIGTEPNIIAVDHAVFGTTGLVSEGMLSTFASFAVVLIGVLVSEYMLTTEGPKLPNLTKLAALLIGIGIVSSFWLPVNKQLWTSSYSVLTAGLSLVLFLACYYLLKRVNIVTEFFSVLGMNCIFLYLLNMPVGSLIDVFTGARTYSVYYLAPYIGLMNSDFLIALAYLGLLWLVGFTLYKLKVFIKV